MSAVGARETPLDRERVRAWLNSDDLKLEGPLIVCFSAKSI